MSLIFGKLTQDFVNFEIVRAQAEQGNADGIAALPAAAAQFRKTSALDATYLVYIGISPSSINLRSSLNSLPRRRHVRCELRLHDHLVSHLRSCCQASP
jgi:hypothetical protein